MDGRFGAVILGRTSPRRWLKVATLVRDERRMSIGHLAQGSDKHLRAAFASKLKGAPPTTRCATLSRPKLYEI